MRIPTARQGRTPVATLLLACALMLGGLGGFFGHVVPGLAATEAGQDLMGGLYTVTETQTVSGSTYWVSFCPHWYCIEPVGVTYVPSTGIIVLTEANYSFPGSHLVNAFQLVDPFTQSIGPTENLPCIPGVPYYPGIGTDVYIACWLSPLVTVVDGATGSVVANISTPFPVYSMAYDPSDELIYAEGAGDALAVLNPSTDTADRGPTIPGATFLVYGPAEYSPTMVYDPITGNLLLFAAPGNLSTVEPSTGANRTVAELPPGATALGIDPAAGFIFASLSDPSSVLVFNASTYAEVANLTIPSCEGTGGAIGFCGGNEVTAFLLDPGHGDVYFASGLALFAVNLSTLSIVGAVLTVGDGESASATFVPPVHEVWGTYEWAPMVGPGYMVNLSYGNTTTWTRFFWLPADFAVPTLGVATGVVVALLAAWGARRRLR